MGKLSKEKFKSLSKALRLQAKEYERRLETLNNENERIKQVQKDSIPREIYDRGEVAHAQKHDKDVQILKDMISAVQKQVDINTTWRTKVEGRGQLAQYIPWIISIATLILLYLTYSKK